MGLKPTTLGTDNAEQLAGITGLGWTTATLGFLGTALGYGHSVLGRLASDSQTLLYVGAVCFLATLGLDRIAGRATDADEERRGSSA
ncbi:MAG: hypothetical protein ABEJ26_06015 [Halosimplex sp.]